MSLGADIESNLPFLRSQAESMMTSACIISRAGDKVFNEETGEYETPYTTIYEGKCRYKFGGTQASLVDAQSQKLVEQAITLSLPVSAAGSSDVRPDDVSELTANPFDPAMIGMKARIAGIHFQSHATARRFPVQVVT